METNTNLPNFLIVGMAKCGTSSLSKYLQKHPEVFISKQKEPRFITSQCMPFPLNGPKDDRVEAWYVKNFEDYTKLFEGATEKAIGEASADTLYFYKGSIPVIKNYFGDPKIIIILRNPVKRAFSAYQHLVRDSRENLSFDKALQEEGLRVENNWELIYHYTSVSKYYAPVKAFLENFSNVKIIFNEDLSAKPNETLREVFQFLDVNPDFEIDTSVRYNASGVPKSKFVHDFLWEENILKKVARPLVRTFIPSKEKREKFTNKLMAKNMDRLTLSNEHKQKLIAELKEDCLKLEGLLQKKEISKWLE